jgi:hypothetical protein
MQDEVCRIVCHLEKLAQPKRYLYKRRSSVSGRENDLKNVCAEMERMLTGGNIDSENSLASLGLRDATPPCFIPVGELAWQTVFSVRFSSFERAATAISVAVDLRAWTPT